MTSSDSIVATSPSARWFRTSGRSARSVVTSRDITPRDLDGYDAIIHLAALSNDPLGDLNETWTREINGRGTIHLATAARQAGVPHFVFSSSCIMYGISEKKPRSSTKRATGAAHRIRPLKGQCGTALSTLADDRFSPDLLPKRDHLRAIAAHAIRHRPE